MVEVRVLGVALDVEGKHVILLKSVSDAPGVGRVLPIWVGEQEATSTLFALGGDLPPRPLTHDLMKTLIESVGARVERIEVTRIDGGTFYAEITLATATGRLVLDARPSDSVALAVRTQTPLFVADAVLEEAGIPAGMVETVADEDDAVDEFKRFLDGVDPEDFQG
ncbi:bifunctional nuclease family protein [Microterricola viridarii]|uniref:BFN domain-containing protein n=1 Tax=Microterricola viridarii TaxID=412690 RepID=A0A0Y0P0T0_9MICO|nr:bifunctional nuclease family protein [Microterricola viridarii]AMB60524.1 hypothetical protein AWU67_12245 [Microterricola viridarii]